MTSELTASTLQDIDKCKIFEQLAYEVNKIPETTVDLGEKGYNVYRDALAFLVEGMSTMYATEHAKTMLNGIVEKIEGFIQNGKPNDARSFLDQQISTLYQAILAEKIDGALPAEKKNWEAVNRIYSGFMDLRSKARQSGKPVEFGGINRTLLPNWYKEKYVG